MKKIVVLCLIGLLVSQIGFALDKEKTLTDDFTLVLPSLSSCKFSLTSDFPRANFLLVTEKKKDWVFTSLVGTHMILSVLDLHSTFRGINNGYIETNPLMSKIIHNKPLVTTVKLAIASLMTYTLYKLKKRSKLAAYITCGCIILFEGYVVYRNYKIGGP